MLSTFILNYSPFTRWGKGFLAESVTPLWRNCDQLPHNVFLLLPQYLYLDLYIYAYPFRVKSPFVLQISVTSKSVTRAPKIGTSSPIPDTMMIYDDPTILIYRNIIKTTVTHQPLNV